MVKLAALALLALLGSVACQGDHGSAAVSPAYSPSSAPASPSTISYPPGASPSQPMPSPIVLSPSPLAQPAFPPSGSSSAPSASSPEYLPSPSPSVSSQTPPTYSPDPSPPTNPPSSPTPLSPSSIAYPPSPSPSQPAYHPSPSPINPRQPNPPSPGQASYIPSPSPSPDSPAPAYPPISNSPSNSPSPSPPISGLSIGHYSYSCPNAEAIVREAVKNATEKNRGTGAGLIRLFFHDCFVRGCDASVLLNTTGSGEPTELKGPPNKTLRGFEVIDAAKAALEEACPGVVSCADVLAFAGRDATFFLTNRTANFPMPAGRYDGRVSFANETTLNLPSPFSGLQQLNESFHAKGLSLEDMVILSGAHSVGRSSCSSFHDRLSSSDMDPEFASSLRKQCSSSDPTAMQDFKTPDDLDRQYYQNVVNHKVLFDSDAALMASNETARMVLDNAHVSGLWEKKFAAAMVKMGGVGVKTSADGEIRKKCWIIN